MIDKSSETWFKFQTSLLRLKTIDDLFFAKGEGRARPFISKEVLWTEERYRANTDSEKQGLIEWRLSGPLQVRADWSSQKLTTWCRWFLISILLPNLLSKASCHSSCESVPRQKVYWIREHTFIVFVEEFGEGEPSWLLTCMVWWSNHSNRVCPYVLN